VKYRSTRQNVSLVTCNQLTGVRVGNRTIRRQTNSRSVKSRTGQLAD